MHWHHWRASTQFPGNEDDGEQPTGHKRCDDLKAAPAGAVPAHQSPYQPEGGARNAQQAAEIERSAWPEALLYATEHERDNQQADRHVEPEDPLPGQALSDRPSHDRTGDQGQPADATKDSQRPRPLLRWEGRAQQRQRQREHQRCAASLDGARGDQPTNVVSERAGSRCSDKQQEASDEHAPPPEAVTQGSSRNEQHREAQGIGIQGPF